jgi:putative transposase
VLRSDLPSPAVYHVTARGVNRCAIYADDDDLRFFTGLFRQTMLREGLDCHAFCLMPNHFHAIVEGAIESISRAVQRVNGVHAQRFNERHARSGHLFQGRFSSRVLRDDEHFAAACAYVWDNPVRAGLCAEAHLWPWGGRVLRPRVNRRERGRPGADRRDLAA